MEKSRLLRLLRTFSPTELRDLEKFAQAGLTKQRPEVAALLAVLSKSLRHGRPVPDKETAFRQIFHREGYDDHRVRLAMSGLYRLAGQFLAVQDFLADAPAAPLRLAQVLRHRRWREVAPRGPEAAPRAAFAEAAAARRVSPGVMPIFTKRITTCPSNATALSWMFRPANSLICKAFPAISTRLS